MNFSILLQLIFIHLLAPCKSQSLGEECSGSVKCPVGSECGSLLNKFCTDNAECLGNICKCSPPFLQTSYGFCQPGFGANCSTFPCNEETFLICSEDDEICTCPLQDTRWSPIQGSCVAIAGSSCSDILSCTDNAYCNFLYDWSCHCRGGFTRSHSTGECLASYESPCDNDDECNPEEFLKCSPSSNKCKCSEGRIWSKDNQKCYSLVGQHCDLKATPDVFPVSECAFGAECINEDPIQPRKGICKCEDGFTKEDTNQCSSSANEVVGSTFIPLVFCLIAFTINK